MDRRWSRDGQVLSKRNLTPDHHGTISQGKANSKKINTKIARKDDFCVAKAKAKAVKADPAAKLSHLCAGADGSGDGGDHQFAVGIDSREDHSLTLDTHHLTRREIGDIEHLFAYQHRGIGITLGYT